MELLAPIIALAMIICLIIPASLWYAFVAVHLWAWFVVPVFNLPSLTVLQAWGITLAISMLKPSIKTGKSETDWGNMISGIIIYPAISLGIGYAIKFWWMP